VTATAFNRGRHCPHDALARAKSEVSPRSNSVTRVANLTAAIATLDRPASLVRCLDALLSGDVLPAEVIIVDQSSDDATQIVLEQHRMRAPIVYIRQSRCGLSASRNAAVARASCPIIAVTDDDCVPSPGWIAAIDRAFASPTLPDAVTGRILPLGPDEPGSYVVSPRVDTVPSEFGGKVVPWLVGSGGNTAVKREWFNRIGGYDERLGAGSPGKAAEDTEFIYRLLSAGAHIRYEPDALIYHERQSRARRLATRWSYGYGIGAFCGIWLRRGDRYPIYILRCWLLGQSRGFAGAIARCRWMLAYQRLLSLRGVVRGLIYGLRLEAQVAADAAGEESCLAHREGDEVCDGRC
jgi:GT2 family glycosyltransferase